MLTCIGSLYLGIGKSTWRNWPECVQLQRITGEQVIVSVKVGRLAARWQWRRASTHRTISPFASIEKTCCCLPWTSIWFVAHFNQGPFERHIWADSNLQLLDWGIHQSVVLVRGKDHEEVVIDLHKRWLAGDMVPSAVRRIIQEMRGYKRSVHTRCRGIFNLAAPNSSPSLLDNSLALLHLASWCTGRNRRWVSVSEIQLYLIPEATLTYCVNTLKINNPMRTTSWNNWIDTVMIRDSQAGWVLERSDHNQTELTDTTKTWSQNPWN